MFVFLAEAESQMQERQKEKSDIGEILCLEIRKRKEALRCVLTVWKSRGGGCYLAENRARILSAILVAILSVLLFLAGAFSMFKKDFTAKAVSIGSITLADYDTRSDGLVFDGDELQKIYDLLTGVPNSKIPAV